MSDPATVPMSRPAPAASPHPAPRPAAAPSANRARRWASACVRPVGAVGRLLAVVFPLLLLAAGLIYFRLSQGPVSVRFLVAPIERALNAEMHGMRVDIADAVLKLSPRGALEFRLEGMRISESDGDVIAMARSAAIELSTRALGTGRLVPSRITLIEPVVQIVRTEQGRLSISIAEPSPDRFAAPIGSDGATRAEALKPGNRATQTASRDLAVALSHLLARMRSGHDAASHLEAIGLRNASLIVEGSGRREQWSLPEVDIAVQHRQRRSLLTMTARVLSGGAPWSLALEAEDVEKSRTIRLAAEFDGLVPRQVWPLLTGYRALEGVDMPLFGRGSAELSSDGQIRAATLEFEARSGNVYLALLDGTPTPIERGRFVMRFDGEGRRLEIAPSEIASRHARLVVAGQLVADPAIEGGGWRFDLATVDGTFEAGDPRLPPLRIERGSARGTARTATGTLVLEELSLKAGGAEIAFAGEIGRGATLDGRIGPMSVQDLKTLWPVSVAPRAREFALRGITKGKVRGGVVKIATSGEADPVSRRSGDRQLALTMEASDLEIELKKELPPIEIPRALLRAEGTALEVTVPDAQVAAAGGRRIALKGGRATIVGIDQRVPLAEVAFRAFGPLPAFLDILERDAASPIKGLGGVPLSAIEGKADAQLRLILPLGGEGPAFEPKIEGRVRLTDGRVKDLVGAHDLSGASLTMELGEKGLELKGDALLAGVHMKIAGSYPPSGTEAKLAPLTITTRLDNADRAQLGIELESMVSGEVPVQIALHHGAGEEPQLHLVADLTPAELTLEELSWRKPIGRPARLEFDIARRRQTKTLELQNFKLVGENIAIGGWVVLGPDNKAREYFFPEFSVNVVTNLEVQGLRRPDNVWEVKAHGRTLDATDVYRSLFALVAQPARPRRKEKPGIDFSAEIDTVTGANDTAMRQVKLKASKRSEQLVALDLKGTLEGGGSLIAQLQPMAGRPRTLQVETTDAGYAFKMIGFYPNMVKGRGRLEVNLDGSGLIERSGRLRVWNYQILGDPVVAEVFQSGDESRPAIASSALPRRRVIRERFDFETLDAQFATGNAQVVIQQAVALGPLIGASLKGTLDFKAQRMQLGGTYVPLSGLSRAIGQIPVLSQLLTGAHGEGVLGLTYAIEGPMANPQVMVNPLSFLAPGILREIFQMTPDNPRVTPRLDAASRGSDAVPQIRASTPAEARGQRSPEAADQRRPDGSILDGWSTTETKGAKRKQ